MNIEGRLPQRLVFELLISCKSILAGFQRLLYGPSLAVSRPIVAGYLAEFYSEHSTVLRERLLLDVWINKINYEHADGVAEVAAQIG